MPAGDQPALPTADGAVCDLSLAQDAEQRRRTPGGPPRRPSLSLMLIGADRNTQAKADLMRKEASKASR